MHWSVLRTVRREAGEEVGPRMATWEAEGEDSRNEGDVQCGGARRWREASRKYCVCMHLDRMTASKAPS